MITRKLPVARVNEIQPGTTKSFRFGVSNGIAYNDEGTIKAYVNSCTHMGGTVELKGAAGRQDGRDDGCRGCVFRCVRHFAEFDPKTGARLVGEAPEGSALTPIALVTEGDTIYAMLELKEDFE